MNLVKISKILKFQQKLIDRQKSKELIFLIKQISNLSNELNDNQDLKVDQQKQRTEFSREFNEIFLNKTKSKNRLNQKETRSNREFDYAKIRLNKLNQRDKSINQLQSYESNLNQNSRYENLNNQNDQRTEFSREFNNIFSKNKSKKINEKEARLINRFNQEDQDKDRNEDPDEDDIEKDGNNFENQLNLKPNYNYKRYKNLNHQQNEQFNRPKQLKKTKNMDKYQRFAKITKHLEVDKEINFGELDKESPKPWLKSEALEDDPDHLERMEVVTDKKPRNYYLFEIKKAIYQDQKLGVQRALELYREMKLDRKLLNADFYKMLIKGCAIVGYVDKAFELYGEYLEREPPVINRSIVTSMFNCCANSPDKTKGLKMAKELYDELRLKSYDFNLINYICLIKTFGRLGDLDSAFAFFDLIVENKYSIPVDAFCNLLVAACSNKDQGLAIATNIIQAMRFLNFKPNIQIYNLLYRIVRDCHFGTEEQLNDQIKDFKFTDAITSEFLRNALFRQRAILKDNYAKLLKEQETKMTKEFPNLPVIYEYKSTELMCLNFIGSKVESVENQLKIVEINYESLNLPENRFKLIGGLDYLFKYMHMDAVKPDIKTVSLLTSIIPNTEQEEIKLLNYIESFKIKMDTDFYNMLIRRANIRQEYDVARKYLKKMSSKGLAPNIQTYGVISIGCYGKKQIREFLDEMDNYGVRPNIVIMTKLIENSNERSHFNMVGFLINRLKKYGIKPTKRLIEELAITDEKGWTLIKKFEENNEMESENAIKVKNHYLVFKKLMNEYLNENGVLQDENELMQFKTEELPRNEEFHKFKVQMTQVLNEKKRFMYETQNKDGLDVKN